jgi:RNA recognition motif-containing protein
MMMNPVGSTIESGVGQESAQGISRFNPQLFTLYVGDLGQNVTNTTLFKLFSDKQFNVASAKVCKDPVSQKPKYGFVNFYKHEDGNYNQ